jgi:hypothetical protein
MEWWIVFPALYTKPMHNLTFIGAEYVMGPGPDLRAYAIPAKAFLAEHPKFFARARAA